MITKTDTLLSKALVEQRQIGPELLQPILDEAAQSEERAKEVERHLVQKMKALADLDEELLRLSEENQVQARKIADDKQTIDQMAVDLSTAASLDAEKSQQLRSLRKRRASFLLSSPM